MDIRKPLICALPLLLVGGLMLPDEATSNGRDSSALTGNGFKPGKCAIDPPAELLALSDWPLDSADSCLGGSNMTDARTADVRLAEVVEARVRPVREILIASIEDKQPPATRREHQEADGAAEETVAPTSAPLRTRETKVERGAELLARAGVKDDELDNLRGGFQTSQGLSVSFGIERVVYVNGVLESTTALRLEDLARLQGGAAGSVAALPPGATVALIQNGGGNTVATNALSGSALGTIIQNSLDNQKIQTVTTVNATVNSVQALQSLRMQSSLQEALNRATLMR
ncbi:MAG: hypothetical protein JSR42_09225 [Proteobacteria bacterium]|nr:hypothetical protein [Pseudomonadota bacterium]MBS0554237.1 hypothetical protein [Pseudomonadota bacterium]